MNKSNNTDCITEPIISKEDAKILGLESNVKGFKFGLLLSAILVISIILVFIFNPVVVDYAAEANDSSMFNIKSKIVYITISTIVFFICAFLLGKMLLKVKQGTGTFNDNKTMTIASVILAVCSLILILIISFSNEFKQNTALSMNYFIIFVLLALSCVAYLFITRNDYQSFNALPRVFQMFYGERAKYTAIFILYIFALAFLYYFDPWNVMTKYMGFTIFLTSIIGVIIVLMIYLFQYFFQNPSMASSYGSSPGFFSFISTTIYILAALGISGFLMYWLLNVLGTFNQDTYNKSNIWHTILNYLMLAGMLAVIWKLVSSGGYLMKSPVFRLVFNTILYIPCILVGVLDYFTGQYNTSKQNEMKMLLIALGLFVGYFLMKYFVMPFYSKRYYGQGGNSIVNEPLTTEKMTMVASYQDLNDGAYVDQSNIGGKDENGESDGSGFETNQVADFFSKLLKIDPDSASETKRNYHYALSFWFYLDSFPPSTSTAYNKTSNIVSFGGNPAVRYNAVTNSLVITMKYSDSCKIARVPRQRQRMKTKVTQSNINTLEGFNQMQTEIKNKIEEVKSMPMQVEMDNDGNMIVYVKEGVQLQKWNNVVLNYNGGTLDIFYNGRLVKSAIELVPCITFDSLKVGDDNGVSGNVANLLYFNENIDYIKVNTLYNSLKETNPPVIPTPGPTIIQSVVTALK
jgi:MFS family permease